jgi:DNA-damage-inducible protein D
MSSKKPVLIPNEGETIENKFGNEKIRKQFHLNEWWWVLEDIIFILTESKDPKDYIKKMKSRDEGLSEGWGQIVTPLIFDTNGGPQKINCSNLEGILRIIQSIPSKNAEPLKRWLAKTGFERIQEKQNPELAIKRAILEYELQGRDKQWIQERIEGIVVRNNLTNEWKNRDVKGQEYGILTNVISQTTFDVSIKEHQAIKGLAKEKNVNIRDHMTPIELLFNRLGEYTALIKTKENNAKGFKENLEAAKIGGRSAGKARKAYEDETGVKVVSPDNFIQNIQQDNLEFKDNQSFEATLEKIALSKKPT